MIFPTNIGISLLGSTLVTDGLVSDPGKTPFPDPSVSNTDSFSFDEIVGNVVGSLMSFQIPAIFKETDDDLPVSPREARIFNYLDKTALMLGQLEGILSKRAPRVPLQYGIGDHELALRERVRKLGENFVKALEDPSINIASFEYEYAQLQEGLGLLVVFSNLDFGFLHTYRDPETKREIYIHRVHESVGLDEQFYQELVASLSEDGFVDFEYFKERLKELGEFCEVAALRNHLREMMVGLSSVAVQEGKVPLRSRYDRKQRYFSDDINQELLNQAVLGKALEAYEKISPEGAKVLGSLIDGLSQTREEWVFYRAFDPESFEKLLAASHEFKNELEAAQLGLQWLQGFLADWMETQTRPLTDFVARELEYQQVLKLLSDPQADQAQLTQTLNEELARVRGEMEVIWGDERLSDLKVARLLLEGQWNQFEWAYANSSDLVTGLDNLRVKYSDGGEVLAIKKVLPPNCGGLDNDCDGMAESLTEADFRSSEVIIHAAGREAGVLLEAERLIGEGEFTAALTHLKMAEGFIARAKMAIQVGQAKKDGMIDEARFEQVQKVFQLLTDRGEDGNPVSLALDFKQILAEEKKSLELKTGDWERLSTQVAEHQTDLKNKRDYIGKAGHSGEFNLFFGDYYVTTTPFDRLLEGYGQLAREIELAKKLPEAEAAKAQFWLLQERFSHLSASPLMQRSLELHGDVEQHKNLGNEIGITLVTLGAGAIANLAKMGVGLWLLRARSAGLALAFVGGMRNARWLVNLGGLAFKILGNSQVLRGTVFSSEVLSFTASEYVLMELLHETTGNEDFTGQWGWEKLILTGGTLGFIHKAMALYEQVILKLLFKWSLSLKNLPLIGKILYTAGRLGTEYVAFTAWDFISQVYLLAKENQLDWENLQTSVFSAKAMAHRAAFLCGLKLGGIVSQPLLSPLYKGVAASVQREFAGRIQSLNARRTEAVEKLKGLHEGIAEEAGSRLDQEMLPLTKALDLENLNQKLARLIAEEKALLGDLAAVGLSSPELQARAVLLDAALKDYANLPKELEVFETLFDAQKGFGIHYDPETQSLVYQKEDHRALMTYLRGWGRVAKQRGGIIYFQRTGADGVPVGPELRFAVDPMSLVAHELPGGEAGKNLRPVQIDEQRAYVTSTDPEKLGPEAIKQARILFHGVKLLFQNIGRKLAEGADEIADSSRTNMPFGDIFGKLLDAGKLMVTRAGSVLSGKWRDINPYELLNSARLEVAEGQALMAEATRVAPSLGRETPRTLTEAADILRAIEALERNLGPDCQWLVRKLKALSFQERANLLLEFDRSQRNIAEVREAITGAQSFEQVANILRRQLQQPVWLRSEKVLTTHGQEDLIRFLELLESYAMVGNLADIVAFVDGLSQLTELGINQAVRSIIQRQFENYEARLRERRIAPVALAADSFTGWRDPRSIIMAWVGYKMAYAAIERPDFEKPAASIVAPEVQGDATIYRLDPEYATYEIGRRLEAQIQLDDPSLPEMQADIYFVNGRWVIKNVDPDTPLRINDVLLANDEVMILRNGDRITLGEMEFRFAIEGVVRGIRAKGPEAQLIKTLSESVESSDRKDDSQFKPLASRGSNLESPENNDFQRARIASEVFPKVLHRLAEFEGNEALRTEHVDEYSKVLELVTNLSNAITASEIYDFYIFDDGTVSIDGKIGKLEEQGGGGFIFKPQGTFSPGEWAVLARTLSDFVTLPPVGDYEIDIYLNGKRYHTLGNHGRMRLAVDEQGAAYQLRGKWKTLSLDEIRGPANLHFVQMDASGSYAYFQGRFFSSPANEISPAKLGNESGYFLKKNGDVAGIFVDSHGIPRQLDKGQESLLEGPQPLVTTQAVAIDRGSPLLADPAGTYLIDTKDEVYHRVAHLPDGTFVEVNLQKLLRANQAIKYVLIGDKIYFVQTVLSPKGNQWKLVPTQLSRGGAEDIVDLNAHAQPLGLRYVMGQYYQVRSGYGDDPTLMGYAVKNTRQGFVPRTSFFYQGQVWAVHERVKVDGQTYYVASPHYDYSLAESKKIDEIALFKQERDGFYVRVQEGHFQGQGGIVDRDLLVKGGRIWNLDRIKSQMASGEQWFMARCIDCDPQTMESQNLITFVRDGDGLRPAMAQEMRDALARLKAATPSLPSLQEVPLGPLEIAPVHASVEFTNHRPLFIAKRDGTNLVSDKPLKMVEYQVTEEIDGEKVTWVYAIPAADDPVVQVAAAEGYYIPTVNDIEAFHGKLHASVPLHDVLVVKKIVLMPAQMGEATKTLGSYSYIDDRMVVSGAKAENQADWLAQVLESTLIHEVSGHGRERHNPYIRKLLELITHLSGKTAEYGVTNFNEYFAVWRELYERAVLRWDHPDQFNFFDFVDANTRAGRTWAAPAEIDATRPQALAGLAGTDGFLAIAAGFDALAQGVKVFAGEVRETADTVVKGVLDVAETVQNPGRAGHRAPLLGTRNPLHTLENCRDQKRRVRKTILPDLRRQLNALRATHKVRISQWEINDQLSLGLTSYSGPGGHSGARAKILELTVRIQRLEWALEATETYDNIFIYDHGFVSIDGKIGYIDVSRYPSLPHLKFMTSSGPGSQKVEALFLQPMSSPEGHHYSGGTQNEYTLYYEGKRYHSLWPPKGELIAAFDGQNRQYSFESDQGKIVLTTHERESTAGPRFFNNQGLWLYYEGEFFDQKCFYPTQHEGRTSYLVTKPGSVEGFFVSLSDRQARKLSPNEAVELPEGVRRIWCDGKWYFEDDLPETKHHGWYQNDQRFYEVVRDAGGHASLHPVHGNFAGQHFLWGLPVARGHRFVDAYLVHPQSEFCLYPWDPSAGPIPADVIENIIIDGRAVKIITPTDTIYLDKVLVPTETSGQYRYSIGTTTIQNIAQGVWIYTPKGNLVRIDPERLYIREHGVVGLKPGTQKVSIEGELFEVALQDGEKPKLIFTALGEGADPSNQGQFYYDLTASNPDRYVLFSNAQAVQVLERKPMAQGLAGPGFQPPLASPLSYLTAAHESFIYKGARWAIHQRFNSGGQAYVLASVDHDNTSSQSMNNRVLLFEVQSNNQMTLVEEGVFNSTVVVRQGRVWDLNWVGQRMQAGERWTVESCVGCDAKTMNPIDHLVFVRAGGQARVATPEEIRNFLAEKPKDLDLENPAPVSQDALPFTTEVKVWGMLSYLLPYPMLITSAMGFAGKDEISVPDLQMDIYQLHEKAPDGHKQGQWTYYIPCSFDPKVEKARLAGYYVPTEADILKFHEKFRHVVPSHDAKEVKTIVLLPGEYGEDGLIKGSYSYVDDVTIFAGVKATDSDSWLRKISERTIVHEISGHGRERANPYVAKRLKLAMVASGTTMEYGGKNPQEYFAVGKEFREFLGLLQPYYEGLFDFLDTVSEAAKQGLTFRGPYDDKAGDAPGVRGTNDFMAFLGGFERLKAGVEAFVGEVKETVDKVSHHTNDVVGVMIAVGVGLVTAVVVAVRAAVRARSNLKRDSDSRVSSPEVLNIGGAKPYTPIQLRRLALGGGLSGPFAADLTVEQLAASLQGTLIFKQEINQHYFYNIVFGNNRTLRVTVSPEGRLKEIALGVEVDLLERDAAIAELLSQLEAAGIANQVFLPNPYFEMEAQVLQRQRSTVENAAVTAMTPQRAIAEFNEGVLLVPDEHGQSNRIELLRDLIKSGRMQWVGMEMLAHSMQPTVDAFLRAPEASAEFQQARAALIDYFSLPDEPWAAQFGYHGLGSNIWIQHFPAEFRGENSPYYQLLLLARQNGIAIYCLDTQSFYNAAFFDYGLQYLVRNYHWAQRVPSQGAGAILGGSAHFFPPRYRAIPPGFSVQDYLPAANPHRPIFTVDFGVDIPI